MALVRHAWRLGRARNVWSSSRSSSRPVLAVSAGNPTCRNPSPPFPTTAFAASPPFSTTASAASAPSFSPPALEEAMLSQLPSHIDTGSAEFRENRQLMEAAVAKVAELTRQAQQGGPESARAKHVARGKMLPRERVAALLDAGTGGLLELSPLAAHGLYDGAVPGAGLITGIGRVAGVDCLVVANDSTVKGGTYYPMTVKKHLRAQEVAAQNRLPCVYLVDSGGVNLPHQAGVFPDRDHFGRIFYHQARLSAAGVPQLAVVMGPCTAGGAYVPAMSDESIMVQEQAHIFLAGPPLVQAATGEVVTAEELGGAAMHTSVSGVADYLAVDDAHALALARRCVANMQYGEAPRFASDRHGEAPNPPFDPPLYPPDDLLGIASTSLRRPVDARALIARIVDGSRFSEFKRDYGPSLVTGFAAIEGQRVGVLANNGVLVSAAALKGAHFIELCTQRGLPLVFLQNIAGFMVGAAAEREGIAKHGAKLVAAVACAAVPKLTVVVGGSYGAGNYGMCGRAFSPNFLWMWPNARIAVMGSEQLSTVMASVGRGSARAPDPALRERVDRESEALYSTARLWDDGIIPPQQTRQYLGRGLRAALGGRNTVTPNDTKFGVFRM